jgi:hypothetical protein
LGDHTLTFPTLLAIDEAKSIEIAEMMLVMEKREPSFSSLRLNFSWKKNVTQELNASVSWQYHGKLLIKALTEKQARMRTSREQTEGTD